jgi:hypothetical protein
MRIAGILAGLSELSHQTRREPVAAASPVATPSREKPGAGPSFSVSPAALRRVLSQYDVTDISPRDFSEMVQQLHETGAISENQLQELAAVRLDLEEADVRPDESIDLLDFYVHRIKKAQRRLGDDDASGMQLSPLLRRLEWMEKLAVLHDTADELGLDALV